MKNGFLTIIGLFITFTTAFAQKDLVTNGGFEDELYGWNGNGASQTPWNFKSGKNSCAIVTTNTDNWVGIDQTIRIPKKAQAIEFSAWIKTTNVVKGKNDWDGAIFTVVFLDNQEKQLGDGVNITKLTGTNSWAQSTKVINMPEKAYSVKILLAMGNASGTMLIDDVTAKVVN